MPKFLEAAYKSAGQTISPEYYEWLRSRPGGGLLGQIGRDITHPWQMPQKWAQQFPGKRRGRIEMAKIIGFGLGAGAAGGAFGGGPFAGGAAGTAGTAGTVAPSAGTGLSEAAGWVDPFVTGGGLSTAAASAGPAAATTAGAPWYKGPMGNTLLQFGLGLLGNKFLNRQTGAERTALKQSTAPYESEEIQRFLPPQLRQETTGPMLQSGMEGIAELLRNPGGLSPTVSDAIRARLSAESQGIAQQFRGIQSNQAGAAARGNLPVSIKGALQSALDIAQERAQRGARQTALTESDQLRRQDLSQVYALLDAIMQMISARQGQAVAGLGAASQSAQQRQAATMALFGNLLSNVRQS